MRRTVDRHGIERTTTKLQTVRCHRESKRQSDDILGVQTMHQKLRGERESLERLIKQAL